MNVYEEAHNLERAIKESEEYKQCAIIREKVKGNVELEKMLKDFQAKQIELQAKQLMGENPGPEIMKSVQDLYGIIMKDPLAAEYLQCEMRLSVMIKDIYEILGDVVNIGK